MTEVTLAQDGDCYVVEARDHATGSVQMCAAISTLIQTLDTWLDLSGAEVSERIIERGHCKLRFSGAGCDTAFELVAAGFFGLEATDSACCKVSAENFFKNRGEIQIIKR